MKTNLPQLKSRKYRLKPGEKTKVIKEVVHAKKKHLHNMHTHPHYKCINISNSYVYIHNIYVEMIGFVPSKK